MMSRMLMVNIADAKARLSEYLEAVARGEQVIICNQDQPVAELRAVTPSPTVTTRALFKPMSEEELEQWYASPSSRRLD